MISSAMIPMIVFFCDGTCNTWLHRGCAGISKKDFQRMSDQGQSDMKFCCVSCQLKSHVSDIESLKSSLRSQSSEIQSLLQLSSTLTKQVSALEDKVSSLQSHFVPDNSSSDVNRPAATYSAVASSSLPNHSNSPISRPQFAPDDRKFNVIVFGVPERPSDLPRKSRLLSDLKDVSTLFQKSSPPTPTSSIVDCRRLGKFSTDHPKPRPILVRFNSLSVVVEILRKRSVFTPYVVKPDLSPDMRRAENLLLKQRWQLIQSGTVKKQEIRIRGTRLYVKDSLHASIIDSDLCLASTNEDSSNSKTPTVSDSNTSTIFTPSSPSSTPIYNKSTSGSSSSD